MYLIVEESKNCPPDERVFADISKPRQIRRIKIDTPFGSDQWCEVVAVDDTGAFTPAQAVQAEDSADGVVWLIFGGIWGVRFRREQDKEPWSFDSATQWGLPFLVLDVSTSIDF